MESRTGAPGKAPASYTKLPSMAVSVPSALAPSLTRQVMALPGPAVRSTSSRLSATRTGCPAFRESATASALHRTFVLPPKPPPTSVGMTLMRLGGTPAIMAMSRRCPKMPCVFAHTVTLPRASTYAESTFGSM